MIDVYCTCGRVYHAEDSHVGKSLRCPKCGTVISIEKRDTKVATPDYGRSRNVTVQEPPRPPAVCGSESTQTTKSSRTPYSTSFKVVIGVGALALLVIIIAGVRHRLSTVPEHGPIASAPRVSVPTSNTLMPPCAQGQMPERLLTGQRIRPDRYTSGRAELGITNGRQTDAVVKVVSVVTRKTHRYFYIRAGESYTVDNLEPGNYWVRFETGKKWVKQCRQFIEDRNLFQFGEPLDFKVTRKPVEEGVWNYVTNHTLTLNEVAEGNIDLNTIDLKTFSEGDEEITAGPEQNP